MADAVWKAVWLMDSATAKDDLKSMSRSDLERLIADVYDILIETL